MHKLTSFLAFTAILCSGCTSCLDPDGEDCIKKYNFTIPISIYPVRDTFHVGDTIWVESLVQNNLVNNLSGEEVDISNLDLKFHSAITEYNDSENFYSDHLFGYVNQVGGFYRSETLIHIVYADSTNDYRMFKVGMIPLNKGTGSGTFHYTFGYIRNDYDQSDLISKGCLDLIAFNYSTNMGKDSSTYQLLPKTFKQTISQSSYNMFGSFAFRVVD
jgi:hypothetical protein